MKKILIISNMYPSKQAPHYGIFVKNTEEILREEDFKVKVLGMHKPQNKFYKLINYSMFYIKSTLNLFFNNYDYIYVHYISLSAMPVLVVNMLGKKLNIVANIHGNDLIPENKNDEKRLIWSHKLLEISQKVIVPSKYFKYELEKRFPKSLENVYIYPSSGINTQIFHNEKTPYKDNSDSKIMKIGFVSRIEKDKGWDLFLNMINKLIVDFPNWEFHMVGEGNEEKDCRELAINLGINDKVHFHKFMDHKKLNDFYNDIDLFIFPTYRKSESLGLVGLEAMACGTIVIGPDSLGPSSYIVDGQNGLMFTTKDINSLVSTVRRAASLSNEKKKQISNEAIKTANLYSKENIKQQLTEIFSQ